MDGLTLFGLFAVTAMLVTYALENRGDVFILAFAAACVLGSAYHWRLRHPLPSPRIALMDGIGAGIRRGGTSCLRGMGES